MKDRTHSFGLREVMGRIIVVLPAGVGTALVRAEPAAAVGTHDPFCMQGRDHSALSDCNYASYRQSAASASGRLVYCVANPYYISR